MSLYEEWIEAIPSYPKITGYLKTYSGYCCLGVACDLVDDCAWNCVGGRFSHSGEVGVLPKHIKLQLGLSTPGGFFSLEDLSEPLRLKVIEAIAPIIAKRGPQKTCSLAAINDVTHDWTLILEVLKERPKSLFSVPEVVV